MKSITLIEGDCLEYMRKMKDKEFDLAIVDPNYGIGAPDMKMGSHPKRKKGGYPSISTAEKIKKTRINDGRGKLKNRPLNQSNISWDDEPPPPEYFEQLFRVSRHQIIWGGNYFGLPRTRCFVIWDKIQPWENFSQVEYAWTSFDAPAKLFRLSNTGGYFKEKKIHPTQKPVALYHYLLDKFAKPGWRILDTHFGSLPSGIACFDMGYELLAFENDPKHFKDGKERLERHMKQKKLFTPEEIFHQGKEGLREEEELCPECGNTGTGAGDFAHPEGLPCSLCHPKERKGSAASGFKIEPDDPRLPF